MRPIRINEMGNPASCADDQINKGLGARRGFQLSQRSTWHLVPEASTQLEPLGT